MQSLIVIKETAYQHSADAVVHVNCDVEVAHHEIGEVISGHLEKQLIRVERVGPVSQKKYKTRVALHAQRIGNGAVSRHVRPTARPYIAYVKLSSIQCPAGLHALDNHSGHLRHIAVGIFLHHFLHAFHTSRGISLIETAQSVDEYELRPVGSHRKTFGRQARVGSHLVISVSLESVVSGGIQRVFYMYAEESVLCKVRITEQHSPLALRIVCLHT